MEKECGGVDDQCIGDGSVEITTLQEWVTPRSYGHMQKSPL